MIVAGVPDDSANSAITIIGGAGGDAGGSGPGGEGGRVVKVFVGFQTVGGKPSQTTDLLSDNVVIVAGDGGDGRVAGIGGSVLNISLRSAAPDADGTEISVTAGKGGDNSTASGGRSGAGGSLTNIKIINQAEAGSSVLLRAGDGGEDLGDQGTATRGANGGSISRSRQCRT